VRVSCADPVTGRVWCGVRVIRSARDPGSAEQRWRGALVGWCAEDPAEERLRGGRDSAKFSAEMWCLTDRVQGHACRCLRAPEDGDRTGQCCGTDQRVLCRDMRSGVRIEWSDRVVGSSGRIERREKVGGTHPLRGSLPPALRAEGGVYY
jgi:xanthine/CO dehydrogenase XdhC/CoxF family maturation factor